MKDFSLKYVYSVYDTYQNSIWFITFYNQIVVIILIEYSIMVDKHLWPKGWQQVRNNVLVYIEIHNIFKYKEKEGTLVKHRYPSTQHTKQNTSHHRKSLHRMMLITQTYKLTQHYIVIEVKQEANTKPKLLPFVFELLGKKKKFIKSFFLNE